MIYGYPHSAGFPQPGYPPTQIQTSYPDVPPGYGLPPEIPQPDYGLLKKNWNALWIVLTALLLLLLVAGGSIYYYLQIRSTPEKTLQAYCNAVKDDDGQALYDTYSRASQTQTDVAHLQQGLRLIDFLSGGVQDCSVDRNSLQENDPQATGRVTFILNNGRANSTMLHLINENGQWKIENNAVLP